MAGRREDVWINLLWHDRDACLEQREKRDHCKESSRKLFLQECESGYTNQATENGSETQRRRIIADEVLPMQLILL